MPEVKSIYCNLFYFLSLNNRLKSVTLIWLKKFSLNKIQICTYFVPINRETKYKISIQIQYTMIYYTEEDDIHGYTHLRTVVLTFNTLIRR